jgi:CHAT domain-containing protein/tetratricopeptide (TPR) repeat protein
MNEVAAKRLCRLLLRTADLVKHRQLFDRAVEGTECLSICLEEARNAVANQPEESLRFSGLAVEIAERRADPLSASAAWRYNAQALRILSRHLEAVAAFEAAAECARRAGDETLAARVLIGNIDSLGWLGRYAEAFALARWLEQTLRAAGAEADAAKALVNAGNLHFRRDQYAEALNAYQRALETLAQSNDPLAVARIQANCANILALLNRVDESLALYEQARAIFAAHGQNTPMAMVDASVGYLRYLSGEYAAALATLTRARQEFFNRGQELETAKCDADMADVYRESNLAPEALECYERAIPVFDRCGTVYERARAELGRASILMTLERPDEAFTALEAADALFARQKNGLQRAHARLLRAYMLRSAGRATEAAVEAQRVAGALARRQAGGLAASARLLCAEIAQEQGRDVSRQLHSIHRAALSHSRGWLACRAQRALGAHYARRGQLQRAIRHLRAGVETLEEARSLIASEEIHVAFLRDKQAIYEDLVGALLARGRPADQEEALECVERSKSRLLLERMQTALDRGLAASPLTAQQQERLAALRAELSRSYHLIYAQEEGGPSRLMGSATSRDTLATLERTYRAALRELEMAGDDARSVGLTLSRPISTGQLREALQADETLIEFYVVNGMVGAFVLNRQGMQVRPEIAHLSEVADASRTLRFQLQRAGLRAGYVQLHRSHLQAGVDRALHSLYLLLLAPLQLLLTTEKLIVVPYGILHGLPFHAFYDGANYALDRYEFLYSPSAAIWHAGALRRNHYGPSALHSQSSQTDSPHSDSINGARPGAEPLIMGAPDSHIVRVAQEVEQIAELFPGAKLFCGECATVEAFRSHAGHCRLMHLATHALFRKDNPLFSGLRFADGWLLASDLYPLQLRCDLATLSACRTANAFVEPGDELFGLVRGFLTAGAQSVAATLWPADDAATTTLMVRFYTLLSQGASRAGALRAAQRATRAEYPHAYHWAAFTLIGQR